MSPSIPRLPAPIVLVHGLLGYDRLRVGSWTVLSYFSTIPEALEAAGNRVLVPRLSPTAGIAQRAAELKAFLDREAPAEPVHLIAHSMGGLDSRYLISCLGMAPRVLTLTTLGTPHRGTAFADWGIRRVERLVQPLFDLLGLSRQAFHDLTTSSCRAFNEQVPDAPGVRYFSVAGRFTPDWRTPEWQLPAGIIAQLEGPNDGLVSVVSATYGEDCQVWEGDHASLVNRALPGAEMRGLGRDRLPDYAALLQRLADEGFA
jgi:triacylglycerol lipase